MTKPESKQIEDALINWCKSQDVDMPLVAPTLMRICAAVVVHVSRKGIEISEARNALIEIFDAAIAEMLAKQG